MISGRYYFALTITAVLIAAGCWAQERNNNKLTADTIAVARRLDEVREKPFSKRFTFGLGFKVFLKDSQGLNIQSYLTYLLSDRVQFGLGGSYAISILSKPVSVVPTGITAFRVFTDIAIFREMLWFHVEGEWRSYNSEFTTRLQLSENHSISTNIGVTQILPLNKRIIMRTQLLYNVSGISEIPNGISLGLGWDYKFGLKRQPTPWK